MQCPHPPSSAPCHRTTSDRLADAARLRCLKGHGPFAGFAHRQVSATVAAGLELPHLGRKAALQMARPLLSRARARHRAQLLPHDHGRRALDQACIGGPARFVYCASTSTGEPALLLMGDSPGMDKINLQNLDMHILSTYALLVACEEENIWSNRPIQFGQTFEVRRGTGPAGAHRAADDPGGGPCR
jgi:hypothetical protein